MAVFQDGGDLGRRFRQGHCKRDTPVGDKGIGLERHEPTRLMNKTFGRQKLNKIGNDLRATKQNGIPQWEKFDCLRHYTSSTSAIANISRTPHLFNASSFAVAFRPASAFIEG
jgi:hypothetical protein